MLMSRGRKRVIGDLIFNLKNIPALKKKTNSSSSSADGGGKKKVKTLEKNACKEDANFSRHCESSSRMPISASFKVVVAVRLFKFISIRNLNS